jgi:hypothetical protein
VALQNGLESHQPAQVGNATLTHTHTHTLHILLSWSHNTNSYLTHPNLRRSDQQHRPYAHQPASNAMQLKGCSTHQHLRSHHLTDPPHG